MCGVGGGLYVFVRIFYQRNSKTNDIKKIKSGILDLFHTKMLIETFYEGSVSKYVYRVTRNNSNMSRPTGEISD